MYLFERLVGLATYTIVLTIACNALCSSKISIKRCLIWYAIALSVLAFFFVPQETSDLVRLWEIGHNWLAWPFPDVLADWQKIGYPLSNIYIYLVVRTGVDSLLPALTSFIFFMLVFSCIWDYAARRGASGRDVALALFVFMSTGIFASLIGGIRNYLAFSVLFWCIYRELVCEKNVFIHLPFYIGACLIHSSALVVTAIRFALFAFEGSRGSIERLFRILVSIGLFILAFRYGGSDIERLLYKSQSYSINDVYTDVWGYAIYSISLVISILTVRQVSVMREMIGCEVDRGEIMLRRYLFVFVILSVCSIPLSYTFFVRLSVFGSLLTLPLVLHCLSVTGSKPAGHCSRRIEMQTRNYRTLILLVSAAAFALSATRGDLSGYKFFVQ